MNFREGEEVKQGQVLHCVYIEGLRLRLSKGRARTANREVVIAAPTI